MARQTVQKGKRHLTILYGVFLLWSLSACGFQAVDPMVPDASPGQTLPSQQESASTDETQGARLPDDTETLSPFGSVPFFRDDTGSNTQMADGWLYGYWGRQLCRVDITTGASKVLYETKSPQNSFCLHEGTIYFLVEKQVDYPDLRAGHKADLRSIKCDGSDSRLLASDIDLTDSWYSRLHVHDGILYLTSPYGEVEDFHFFQLLEDGTVQEVTASDTLYGTLPQGYSDACSQYRYRDLPALPSSMTYLGYAFVCDEENRLYRFLPSLGQKEEIRIPLECRNLFLTNQALVYALADTWYALSLDDGETVTEIGTLDCREISFWDESGFYCVERMSSESLLCMTRLGWNGETRILHYDIKAPEPDSLCNILYSDGTWLYYSRLDKGDDVIYRILLEQKDEAKPFYLYYDNPLKDICTQESYDCTLTVTDTQMEGHFSLSKVTLTEETKAAHRINAFLQEQLSLQEASIQELMESVRNIASQEGQDAVFTSNTIIDSNMYTSVDYLDDRYIGFTIGWYQYMQGAAHGNYGYSQYVFDRSTGERLRITDVVRNSPSEICAIIAPYVEASADWGTDEEGWESMILEDGRFYLTTEGIGIHFDVYEMTCYAAGSLDIVVPYEEFELL